MYYLKRTTQWIRIIRISIILGLALGLSSCAMSTLNLQQGIHDFKVQNYRAAFVKLMPEARKGNAEAQYAVGYMYYYGEGVVENQEKALEWIRKAAYQGQPDAQSALKLIRQQSRHPYSNN